MWDSFKRFEMVIIVPACLMAGLSNIAYPSENLSSYEDFLADSNVYLKAPAPERVEGVVVSYLGTSGYLIQSGSRSILIDPYFSRVDKLFFAALGKSVDPDERRICRALAKLPGRIDYILVTHGHIDHLLDVPSIAKATKAKVILSETSYLQATAAGLGVAQMQIPLHEDTLIDGNLKITAFESDHAGILGLQWYHGSRTATPTSMNSMSDWKSGRSLTFLIEIGGKRIFMSSGAADILPPDFGERVDLAIVGVALGASRRQFSDVVKRVKPRVVMPTHQDDFQRSLDEAFEFSTLSDFDEVVELSESLNNSGIPDVQHTLLLLDYFQSWEVD